MHRLRSSSTCVFDLGCGAGHFAKQFYDAGSVVLGGGDVEARMTKQYVIQCPGAVTTNREFDDGSIDWYTDFVSSLARERAPPASRAHLHVNMTLGCEALSQGNKDPCPELVKSDCENMAKFVKQLRSKFEKVSWISENVPHPLYIEEMYKAFGKANCQHMILSSFNCSSEERTRAFFASNHFDLDAIMRARGPRLFVCDLFPEAELIASGSGGSGLERNWRSSAAPMPTFTTNGLYYLPHHHTRATVPMMVPLGVVAQCRGLEVPTGPGVGVVAQRVGLGRAVTGWIGRAFAKQLP